MGIVPFIKNNPPDKDTFNLELNMSRCWDSIVKHPLLQNFRIVKDISITINDTIVTHGLNKPITGWIVIRSNANITVYESSTTNNIPSASVILKASGSGTISVLFF